MTSQGIKAVTWTWDENNSETSQGNRATPKQQKINEPAQKGGVLMIPLTPFLLQILWKFQAVFMPKRILNYKKPVSSLWKVPALFGLSKHRSAYCRTSLTTHIFPLIERSSPEQYFFFSRAYSIHGFVVIFNKVLQGIYNFSRFSSAFCFAPQKMTI